MSKLKLYIITANLLLVLGFFTFSITKKEVVLNRGEEVLLSLAPVDPRSIMQGDYMSLSYAISNDVYKYMRNHKDRQKEKPQYCVVKLNEDRVASFVRLSYSAEELQKDELAIRVTWGKGITFGSKQYFFQEGTSKKYVNARYGMLKVVTEGDMIGTCSLVGLCGEDKQLIK